MGGRPSPRAILEHIATRGQYAWKKESSYHRRSIAENMMFRLKKLGERLFYRTFERQAVAEVHARAVILQRR